MGGGTVRFLKASRSNGFVAVIFCVDVDVDVGVVSFLVVVAVILADLVVDDLDVDFNVDFVVADIDFEDVMDLVLVVFVLLVLVT